MTAKQNIVGNNFGTSNEQIIKGLSKSAAAFSMMGGSLEENIALFTAAQEIVQNRIQDSIDAYEQLSKAIEGTEHSLKDYMTFDQDGNFISKGAWDFVQDVNTLLGDGFASQDGNGIWSLDLTGDKLERVAAAFGTTTELVELMGKALSDAGMDVQFDPKDIHDYNRELEALNEELDNSHSKLKEIQDNAGDGVLGDFDLDYDAASLSLDEIDAKISELNDKKIELEADADGVEGGLEAVDALNNEIEALSEQKVMLSIGAALEGGATIEELLGLNNTELAAKLNVDTSQAETARALLESMSSADVAVPMTVKLDEGQLSALLSATGTANFELGDYPKEVPNVTGTANYNGIFPTSAPTIHGTVVYSGSFPSGGSRAAGSMLSIAHADGTAYNVLNYKRLQESNLNLIKYGNAIRQIRWDAFDYLQDKIANISDETEFLIDLFDNSKLFDDNGNLTNEGSAVVGLHAQNYGTLMAQADQYAKEIKNLDAEIAKDPNNQTLLERRQKLLELQQKAIKSAESEKKALVDLVQDGISAQVKAMDDLIDKYQDSLESAKDLYDYQKKVSKQTKNIADIEKQLSAYQGNTSEETKATIQKLKQELQDAQEDLQETEYKQYVSDQKKLLDNLKSEYEETLNSRLDDVNGLVQELIDYTNANSSGISETILAATKDVGYELSDAIRRIWSREDMSLDGVVTYYGNDFGKKLTSTNNILGGIYATICAMAESSNGVVNGNSYNGNSAINAAVLAEMTIPTSLFPQSDNMYYYDRIENVEIPITGINNCSDKINLLRETQNNNYNVSVDVGGVTIPINHVNDINDFVRQLQNSKRFEKMVQSMTVNQLGDGSRFDKYKYNW